jgi:hypothetical protein
MPFAVKSCFKTGLQSPNFKTFKDHGNRFREIDSASLCSLAGRYENPIPTRVLAPHRLFLNSSPDLALEINHLDSQICVDKNCFHASNQR